MKRKIFIWMTILNIGMLVFIFIIQYLMLPTHVQKVLSTGIYMIAAIAGIIIGSLVSKVYFLRKRYSLEHEALRKKEENIQLYLTNIVHDLRSPAASINMISELLQEEVTNINPIHSELIQSMKKTSNAMLSRICCILDNAAAEQNNSLGEIIYENPYPLIHEVINKHQILAIEKNIDIIMEESDDKPAIYFNKEALDSVFSNLLSNAIKYSLPNTKIRIWSTKVKNGVSYFVRDEGLGMNHDDLLKVFGRFSKLSARPTGNEDSSGIGLSIVKSAVERMSGKVSAFSEGKGKGSTFTVTLPTSLKVKTMTA